MREELNLRAYGKINLGLDVLRKRPDGYHEVRMIMQTVTVYDRIHMKIRKHPGIQITTNLYYLPTNRNNLVYRAAELLMEEFNIRDGISIDLYKKIPVAAGMAGGSSDAAAVLVGINTMFGLGLTKKELMDRGVTLGADIPYCIMRGTALAEGIGEELSVLPPMPDCYIALAKPKISVSTKFVYGNLKADELEYHPDIDGMIHALEKKSLGEMIPGMGNVLETVTIPAYPVIQNIKDFFMENNAEAALMSGSGPTVFGIYRTREEAERACSKMRRKKLAGFIDIVRPFNQRM